MRTKTTSTKTDFNANPVALEDNTTLDFTKDMDSIFIGKWVIVRTYSAGVFLGQVAQKKSNEVIITQARRLWQWSAAQGISLSEIAVFGLAKTGNRITAPVPGIWLEAIELLPVNQTCMDTFAAEPHAAAQ